MSHIKDRLTDYHNQMKKLAEQHEMITARDVLDMIEQLQDDLELDENENDWIPVEKKPPEPGKCFKYIDQRGEDATEHIYEVIALYPYCVLLRDTRNGVRTCPGYNTLSLMLRGSEVNE